MDEIAAVAGTSKTVLYRHFADKGQLYLAVTEAVHELIAHDLRASVERAGAQDARGAVAAAVDAYLALVERDPEVYRFVVERPLLAGGQSPRRHRPRPRPGAAGGAAGGRDPRRRRRTGRPRRHLGPRPGGHGARRRRRLDRLSLSSTASRGRRAPRRPRLGRPRCRPPAPRHLHVRGAIVSERQRPNHQTQRTGPGEERAVNTTADALRTVLDGRWAHIKDRARRELPARAAAARHGPRPRVAPRPGRRPDAAARRDRPRQSGFPRGVRWDERHRCVRDGVRDARARQTCRCW